MKARARRPITIRTTAIPLTSIVTRRRALTGVMPSPSPPPSSTRAAGRRNAPALSETPVAPHRAAGGRDPCVAPLLVVGHVGHRICQQLARAEHTLERRVHAERGVGAPV